MNERQPICERCRAERDFTVRGLCVDCVAAVKHEVYRLTRLIDTPHTEEFLEAVPLEAAHQIKRWGVEHDEGKQPEDWFWLVGYLAGKALHAAKSGDIEKAKHHAVSTAAVMLNWHRRLTGDDMTFRPGIKSPDATEGMED